MRSLHVDTGREWRGGQAQVLHLLGGLKQIGDEPLLVAPPNAPLIARARERGLACVEVSLRGEWDLVSLGRLIGLCRRYRPSVVHAHTAHAVTLAGLAAHLTQAPWMVAARRVDFPLSRAGRAKHAVLADVTATVSAAIATLLAQQGLPPGKLEVVPSGIDIDAIREAAAEGKEQARAAIASELAPGVRLVGTAGALVDHKDHATLVAAAAELRDLDVHVVIAGEGRLRPALERQIADRTLAGRMRLLGFHREIAGLIGALDVFVLPSHMEGLGTSVLDAMALGTPVVATRVGGVPEMIEHESNGLLVPPRDPKALAAAIRRLLDDRELAARLADAASDTVATRFSAGLMAARTRALYERGLSMRGC